VKKTRKHYTGEEKVAILRRHLLEKEPISSLCDELGLQPTVLYRWLAEGPLRERSRGLPGQRPLRPLGRAGARCIPGEEDPTQERGPGRVDGRIHRTNKRTWGTLTGVWVPHDVRDQIVDFVRRWSEATEISAGGSLGGSASAAANSTTGKLAKVASTSTTPGFPGIFGWRTVKCRRASISTCRIRWRATGG
jgi:hypothetical protein